MSFELKYLFEVRQLLKNANVITKNSIVKQDLKRYRNGKKIKNIHRRA